MFLHVIVFKRFVPVYIFDFCRSSSYLVGKRRDMNENVNVSLAFRFLPSPIISLFPNFKHYYLDSGNKNCAIKTKMQLKKETKKNLPIVN